MKDPQKKYGIGTVCKIFYWGGGGWGLSQFHVANLALNTDVDQDTFGKVTKHNKHDSREVSPFPAGDLKATQNRHDSTTHIYMKHN